MINFSYCPHCGHKLYDYKIESATVNRPVKKYKSSLYCEHANECPTGPCRCPQDCACREHMCK